MINRILILLMALMAADLTIAAPRSVDAEKLDVAGVKLGMTPEEAASALVKTLGVSRKRIQFEKAIQANPVTKKKEIDILVLDADKASLKVYFEPNVPFNARRKLSANLIIYEQEWTPDNVESMKQAALKKYGEPSNGTVSFVWEWCAEPSENMGLGCSGFHGAVLKFGQTDLRLEDPKYKEAVNKFRNKMNSSKPIF